MKYRVCFFQNSIYEVFEFNPDIDQYEKVWQGSLTDCEAWIRLKLGLI